MPRLHNHLRPLSSVPCQAYFDNRLQLADVIDAVLDEIGPASLLISTYSTSEAFLRRLLRLKNNGRVTSCSLFCDFKAARKTVLLDSLMTSVCNAVFLCQNHSKVVLLRNDRYCVAVVTSQNQTQGNRTECGIITTEPLIITQIEDGFNKLKSTSMQVRGMDGGF